MREDQVVAFSASSPFIVIAGPLPPPVHGFSYITQEMARLLAEHHGTAIIDLAPHTQRGGIRYHLRRLRLTLGGLLPLLRHRRKTPRAFYVACEGNLGIVYTIILSLFARLLGYPVFIHHHSFGYIERHSALMSLLLRASGAAVTHIFLCPEMAQRFAIRYRRSVRFQIVSNSAFVDEVSGRQKPGIGERPLVVGLLSNLNDEKGLGLFLELLGECHRKKLGIRGILAGPPQSPVEREAIRNACAERGGVLDYRGPVYGDAKDAFYGDIDVFVFPTRYANEAQPTVIFEALAHGIPVLSYERGCICSQVLSHGAVAPRAKPFVPFALDWLERQIASPEAFSRLRLDAQAAFKEDRRTARQAAASIFVSPPATADGAQQRKAS